MDILKRELAPITAEAWAYIDEEARQILSQVLSARRVVDVDGPRGWEHSAMALGRLSVPDKQPFEGVNMGVRRVLPLVEARVPFELDIWELDNIVRGARDIDVDSLEKAAHDIARLEERAVYYGLSLAQIKGFMDASGYEVLTMNSQPEDIVEKVTMGLTRLVSQGVQGPYALVVSPGLWIALSGLIRGFPLNKYVESLLGGPIVVSPFIENAFLISTRGGDTSLSIGQDMSIGYGSSNKEKVKLFFTESFTFHVLEPRAIHCFNWSQGG
ncbi:family 1 encapsulin nanocompartment shell protein [Desulfocurvibacter africanus]|uniref:Linocin M18 bacteriocin protein n=1 Tax=Desulfocurvibacter africanus subsp. africanus str. Walvis Bay TaxID=690850 RepID=F3YZI3_DESAF|nr:family 1 encapsulin nanocompartment shell protein [Desulfocurvibacter africanus]EGJ49682.1 Linocin M18 bacteriocin protein [Desulfocurvibacter africanus subsp. africanus str. Walvis Bay]